MASAIFPNVRIASHIFNCLVFFSGASPQVKCHTVIFEIFSFELRSLAQLEVWIGSVARGLVAMATVARIKYRSSMMKFVFFDSSRIVRVVKILVRFKVDQCV